MLTEQFINIQIDKALLEQEILKIIEKRIQIFEVTKLFYSMDDLMNLTSFSKGHIYNTFFCDSRFKNIRRKVGRKWVFPVDETNQFLKQWILEQPHE